MPLVLPYQNARNAFRVISGDFVTMKTDRNCTPSPTFGADDAKSEATQCRHVGLDENEFPVPLVLRKVHFAMGGMLGNEKEILQRRRST
jgi:isoleucyl-tRNA synthetase